ncbi:MAG: DUF3857 domain-containing protein [Bacteroidota bacterium]
MKNSIFLCCLLMSSIATLSAQRTIDYKAHTIPQELKEGATSVIRYEKQTFELLDDSRAKIDFERVVTVLDVDSDAYELYIYHNPDIKVQHLQVTLYDAMGKQIRRAKKDDVNDILAVGGVSFYVDSRYKHVDIRSAQVPYTLHIEYKLTVKDVGLFTSMPDWTPQEYEQSVELAEYEIIYPSDNKIFIESNQLPEPEESTDEGVTTLSYALENSPAPDPEWATPAYMSNLPYLMAGFDRFEVDGYKGSMRDWNSFGAFLYKLSKDRQQLPADLAAEVAEAVSGLETDMEKIDALYRFMQERTRYVSVQLGIGGWQPFDATYVHENRYGECKALSNYMRSILAEVGIESWPVAIFGFEKPYYDVHPNYAVNAFNHQMLYVPAYDMFLECTSSNDPTGYVPESSCFRQALLITPEGGRLHPMPNPLPSDNTAQQHIKLKILSDGTAQLELDGHYTGSRQDMLRGIDAAMGEEDQLEYLHQRDYLPALKNVEFDLNIDSDKPEAQLQYACELDRYARRMGSRLFLPINRHFAYDFVPPADSERNLPIKLRRARMLIDTVTMELPGDMEVESIGEALTEISHEAGNYRSTIEQEENTLVWTRVLTLNPIELPAEAYEDLRNFYIEIGKADSRQIVLKEKRTR